ncbi:MAG: DUF924 family protein [Alphaproteobacteria bacterium]|jgi:uncharacterized protein (DUF924 family)|nr:DUF924 family protein [Alphaproteobacteria bacterium]
MSTVDDVIAFWVDDVGPDGWYAQDDALDARIRDRYMTLWEKARDGRLCNWASCPEGCLAYLIVTDQFPRNMFRDDPRAFATDALARKVAARACHLRFDGQIAEPARQFFYLPLMHSESQMDQDRAVRMFLLRMPKTGAQNLLHARAHRAVIREFGRFPYRNDALGRDTTSAEQAFLTDGGYGLAVRKLQQAA